MNVRLHISVLAFLLLLFSAHATHQPQYQMKLLAVQESPEGLEGSTAQLFLELKPGSGRVFLDTFPLTKMDTQISTRFAKEIACKYFKLDCNKYDFIYTIKAESNIIGGPSAGAAIASLTTIAMLDLEYDDNIAVTGTINSGGIIGQVGGIKEKMEAAKKAGLSTVLIPLGSAKSREFPQIKWNASNNAVNISLANRTIDLVDYGRKNLSLSVEEVIDLDEIIFQLTGKQLNHKNVSITQDTGYQQIMRGLQDVLCGRGEKIRKEMEASGFQINETVAENLGEKEGKARNATATGDYYSAASFCFGNNIVLKSYYYQQRKLSSATVQKQFTALNKKVQALEQQLTQEKIETITDLQAHMVVKERLNDVKKQMQEFERRKAGQPVKEFYGLLAYAEERFFSALSWMQFFEMEGTKFMVDEERLKNSCQQKISESEERYQYASFFLGELPIFNIQERIQSAKKAAEELDFEFCLIEASQAKAEANAILSTLGLSEENFGGFLESKQRAVERVIFENSAAGMFPILGYSYYQYALSLKEEEYTSLIYLEYALEMSDLSIYFPGEENGKERKFEVKKEWILVGEGFVIGVLVAALAFFIFRIYRRPKLVWVRK
ncbi:hypothetical protein HYX14_00575 [Candidatus Woesearchaeota archaeon]|nr:hypothetical protein [Candidatus Woesearchaeota archaeon]